MKFLPVLLLAAVSANAVTGPERHPDAPSARRLAKDARKAQRAGDILKAYLLYSQAAAADPGHAQYWTLSQALRTRALQQSKSIPASITESAAPSSSNSISIGDSGEIPISVEDIAAAKVPNPPIELKPKGPARNFDIRGDNKSLFEQVLRAFGIDTIFDADYLPGSQLRFRLEDADFHTAVGALQAATSSFLVPLSDKLCMVYKDTQQKRTEAEPTMFATIDLPNTITTQEAQELGRAIQQVLEVQRLAIDNTRRQVLIRDKASKVRTAQALYQQLAGLRSQVMIEMEIIDVQSHSETNYGGVIPNATSIIWRGRDHTGLRLIPEAVSGLSRFLLFGGGMSTMAFGISDARLFANFTRSNSQSLYRALMRGVDSQAATLHVGDKYPLVTQQYSGTSGTGSGGLPFSMAPTVNFEDLGLTLKVTPRIHNSEEVSLQVEAEFKVLGSGSYNGIPVIASRKYASTIRLREGELGILAGVLSSTEARTISGVQGLGAIPVLSTLLNQTSRAKDEGQALVVLAAHITDSPPAELATRAIYTGTDSRWNTLP